MPEIDNGSAMPSMSIKVGETLKNATPAPAASSHVEEKTSTAQTNTQSEVQSEPAEKAVTQENTEDFVSGAAKARKLGESRRKLAKSILDGASTEEGRENFQKLVQEDKDLDKYFKKHFPAQYQAAFSEAKTSKTSDTEISTRAKILAEDIQADKEEDAHTLAVQLKFTEDEADELKEMALKLEGTKVRGKELDYETALKRAARIIHPDKAKAGITVLPSSRGLDNTQATQTQAKNEELVDKMRKVTGYKPDQKQALENLNIVNQGYDEKNRRFVMPENLM
jgi:biotin operon repressor